MAHRQQCVVSLLGESQHCFIGGGPCTPPGSLRCARAWPLAPLVRTPLGGGSISDLTGPFYRFLSGKDKREAPKLGLRGNAAVCSRMPVADRDSAHQNLRHTCLLYTSDAADERSS